MESFMVDYAPDDHLRSAPTKRRLTFMRGARWMLWLSSGAQASGEIAEADQRGIRIMGGPRKYEWSEIVAVREAQ